MSSRDSDVRPRRPTKNPIWPLSNEQEKWWIRNQPYLLSRGYKLRPRYEPDWIPSWTVKEDPREEYEDAIAPPRISCQALDAIRTSDGMKVVLKKVPTDGEELRIAAILSTPRLRSDPRNHTIPILEVITVPNESWTLLVMPYCRRFDDPPFHCRAEFIEAMRQYLEGLQFMHDQNICHGDIAPQNLMMDESRVVPDGSHFFMPRTHSGFLRLFRWNNRCSVGPINYYYIDFGLSMHFPDGKATASTVGTLRTFPTIPELSLTVPYDPFKVDIYQLGLTIQKLIQTYRALRDFRPVATAMLNPNPGERPSPTESLVQLNSIAAGLSQRTLNASMWERGGVFNHLTRKLVGGYYPSQPYI
ncbi:kinase-like domain-containing protein [Mycena galericulata]|nr:kinase-like domain-containing protein [Mycena galericulata]